MKRLRSLAVPFACALVVLTAAALFAQDGEDEGEDEGGGGPFGGQYTEDELEAAFAPEFHPSYNVTHTRDQDVSSWQHNFNVNYSFTRRLSLRARSPSSIFR